MLGTPVKYRKAENYLLYEGIINHSWPALLKWPINPLNKMEIFMEWFIKLLMGMGIYKQVKGQYIRIKKYLIIMKYR